MRPQVPIERLVRLCLVIIFSSFAAEVSITSHVTTLDIEILDLDSLKKAAEKLGLEVRQKTTYHWFGRHVGDYPLPEGFTEAELGNCEFALGVVGNQHAYEIGVVKSKTGNGYTLLFDFWGGGSGLMKKVSTDGQTLNLLKTEYGVEVAKKQLARRGYRNVREIRENGKVKLVARG